MSEEMLPHKRRVRYSGRNPRRFEDRYKELDAANHADLAEHVMAKGRTPAGSHRPICVEEILAILRPRAGEVALDATLGYGGHSQRLLPLLLPGGRLFAVDVDPHELPRAEARLRALGFDEEAFVARRMSFSGVRALLDEAGGGFDCILADLGVSSMQLDNPARGFTYKADGPLDLRLDPHRGQPAAALLRSMTLEKLELALSAYADEPNARAIGRAIKSSPAIETTTQLASAITQGLKRLRPAPLDSEIRKSIQRAFMAIRIAVNEELTVLDRFLHVLPSCLNPGGRVAILTFHSGEDRRVKKAFQYGLDLGLYTDASPEPLRPSPEEQRSNPRSTCAKLRWAVRSDLAVTD
jgi:16S rRNA (cytosine1402-N4)-methyltransferase